MKTTILAASAALMLSTAAASAAEPGSWSTRWTGPHGGVYEGSGKCADGGLSKQRDVYRTAWRGLAPLR